MKPTLVGPGVPVPDQVAGVVAGEPHDWATPIEKPWKLSVLVTPRATVTTFVGELHEFDEKGVLHTERVQDPAGAPLHA